MAMTSAEQTQYRPHPPPCQVQAWTKAASQWLVDRQPRPTQTDRLPPAVLPGTGPYLTLTNCLHCTHRRT